MKHKISSNSIDWDKREVLNARGIVPRATRIRLCERVVSSRARLFPTQYQRPKHSKAYFTIQHIYIIR